MERSGSRSLAGWGICEITRHQGRCPSVISRKVRRNTIKTCGHHVVTADVTAQCRRACPQAPKVALDPVLQARAEADIAAPWTPNEIVGRLRLEAADSTYTSHAMSRTCDR